MNLKLFVMKKIAIILYFAINSSFIFAQISLTIEGTSVNNASSGSWAGVNISRNQPTTFSYRNNSITSINSQGYMLQAGDESSGSTNNNLDGEIITGNKFVWNGTNVASTITHALFVGYNINALIKYNYLYRGPTAMVLKSNGMTYTSGGVAYNILNKTGNIAVAIKGTNGINVYNNTFYSDEVKWTSNSNPGTAYGIVDIFANDGLSPWVYSTGTKIKNNIFYTVNQIYNITIEDTQDLAGFESDYNIFWCEAGTPMFNYLGTAKTFAQWQALGYDTHSKVINPNFNNFTDFVPSTRLDYGTDLGSTWQTGLSTTATWVVGSSPTTTNQNGFWQVGARIYDAITINPVYLSSVVENAAPNILEMNYSLSLANIVPAVTAFNVQVNSVSRTVNSVAIVNGKVRLTLISPVANGNTITVSYTKPASNPLQTSSGVQAASIALQTVVNNCTPPVPAYIASVVENATPSILDITYNLSLASIVPPNTAFNVQVNSAYRAVNSVSVSGNRVQLTLASAVKFNDIIMVSYTKPATNPLQTDAGGAALSISAQTVINKLVAPIVVVTPVTIKMTISPIYIHKILNVLLSYSSIPSTAISPEIIRISDLSGKVFMEKLLVTGVTALRIPINLNSDIYNVLILAGGIEMASQRIHVY
jgi:uncharacterized repeat protein (TIGR02059 family)